MGGLDLEERKEMKLRRQKSHFTPPFSHECLVYLVRCVFRTQTLILIMHCVAHTQKILEVIVFYTKSRLLTLQSPSL